MLKKVSPLEHNEGVQKQLDFVAAVTMKMNEGGKSKTTMGRTKIRWLYAKNGTLDNNGDVKLLVYYYCDTSQSSQTMPRVV